MSIKSDNSKKMLSQIESKLICPICHEKMFLEFNSIKCINNHNFDISNKGTVVLYKTSKLKINKIYTTKLFNSRRKYISYGFYDNIHKYIAEIIDEYNNCLIVDMGVGEGIHDISIKKYLKNNCTFVGVDLAKEGIDLSNDYNNYNYIGIVADLNNLPLKSKTVDVILNILSPSNEKEIERVLKDNGIIIKVTPKKEYLQELRKALNIKDYENENVIDENISLKYDIISKKEFTSTYKLNQEQLNDLVNMTPLMNNINIIPKIEEITIALNVYVLKVRK